MLPTLARADPAAESAVNQTWVAEVTYLWTAICIWTAEGWPSVATVIDLLFRSVVG